MKKKKQEKINFVVVFGTLILFLLSAYFSYMEGLQCASVQKKVIETKIIEKPFLPSKQETDAFCISKGYQWGTAETLLCNTSIRCFKEENGLNNISCVEWS